MRIFFTVLVVVITGCKQTPELPAVISPYKIDIQQGNVVTQDMVAKLKAGMTRSQVRFVLGTPLVIDPFRTDRWDYVYLYQRQGKPDERRRITVIFDADKLARIGGNVVLTDSTLEVEKPAAKPPAAATPATKPGPAVTDKPATPKATAAKLAEKPAKKPAVAAAPATKPDAAAAGKPVAPKPEAARSDAAKPDAAAGTAAAGAAQPEAAKSDSAKPEIKPEAVPAEAPKTDTAKSDAKKEKPKDKGFFGRMLEKIGF